MNNINPTSSISFNGLIIHGAVPQKSVKKLGDFASRYENINFINDLEKIYGVDAVLDSQISKMSFSHPKYGDLSGKYNCGSYSLENVFMDISTIFKNIKLALNKAEKDFLKSVAEIEKTKRGC